MSNKDIYPLQNYISCRHDCYTKAFYSAMLHRHNINVQHNNFLLLDCDKQHYKNIKSHNFWNVSRSHNRYNIALGTA